MKNENVSRAMRDHASTAKECDTSITVDGVQQEVIESCLVGGDQLIG